MNNHSNFEVAILCFDIVAAFLYQLKIIFILYFSCFKIL